MLPKSVLGTLMLLSYSGAKDKFFCWLLKEGKWELLVGGVAGVCGGEQHGGFRALVC